MLKILTRKHKAKVLQQERELETALVPDPELAKQISLAVLAYTAAARWFEKKVADGHKKDAKLWRNIAFTAIALAFMAVGALIGITPLKEVIPYLVRVDQNTGFTDLVPAAKDAKNKDEIDDIFWVETYVRWRERYNFADQKGNYRAVELLSYGGTFQEYKDFQLSSKGYLELLGEGKQIRVDVHGTNFLIRGDRSGTAQVRFTKTVVDRAGKEDSTYKPMTFLTTVSYDYGKKVNTKEMEQVNPRGWGAKSYEPVPLVGGQK